MHDAAIFVAWHVMKRNTMPDDNISADQIFAVRKGFNISQAIGVVFGIVTGKPFAVVLPGDEKIMRGVRLDGRAHQAVSIG